METQKWNRVCEQAEKTTQLRSALAVPLEGLNGLVGVLSLYQNEADAFSSDHLRILQVITSKVALTIENALKYRQVESSATIDYLTGLPNARALYIHLDRELARCKRENSTLAVMVRDLDGFKQINDRYGHIEGDKTLAVFSTWMREACREYDYVARMGGDEFVMITPNMTQQAATEKAARLDDLARKAGRQLCGKDLLSLSVGTAFYPQDGSDVGQLLAEADRKMYSITTSPRARNLTRATLHCAIRAPFASLGMIPKVSEVIRCTDYHAALIAASCACRTLDCS